jgi:hypothetical protein
LANRDEKGGDIGYGESFHDAILIDAQNDVRLTGTATHIASGKQCLGFIPNYLLVDNQIKGIIRDFAVIYIVTCF